jgi:hypothetical protein
MTSISEALCWIPSTAKEKKERKGKKNKYLKENPTSALGG